MYEEERVAPIEGIMVASARKRQRAVAVAGGKAHARREYLGSGYSAAPGSSCRDGSSSHPHVKQNPGLGVADSIVFIGNKHHGKLAIVPVIDDCDD